ncbi:hypothetical protein MS3_00001232 [Schistosoma haematobium]|uniref:Uncharacterized protein n=1 Tax=Schistosoma haematobium TaxID=6185 RepID=A0A922LRL5_SCHHA|nr:hypothetical protein MS3_00001232 [Schistosoma haematobium]KAH9591977.1 hypothetical protein MS3_00001232 [Schistosoma haematobium]
MNRTNYIDKMNTLLRDQTKFQTHESCKELDEKIERQLTTRLKPLKRYQYISEDAYIGLKLSGTHPPRLHDLPTIHKLEVRLRPIIGMSNSLYHSTAKWLVRLSEVISRSATT